MPDLHDDQMEAAVLACAFVSTELAHRVVEETGVNDYYGTQNQAVRLGIEGSLKDTGGVDTRTVMAAAESQGKALELVHVVGIDAQLPDPSRLAHYVARVRELAARRSLVAFAGTLQAQARDLQSDLAGIASGASQTVSAIASMEAQNDFMSPVDLAGLVITASDRTEDQSWGVTTGFGSLDRITRGMHPGQVVVLAGRPGMGKTALALTSALAAARQGQTVAFFSFEMVAEDLALRWASQSSDVPFSRIRRGSLPEADVRSLVASAHEIKGLQVYACDRSSLDAARIHTMCRRLQRSQGLDLVVVDYLQLVRPGDTRAPKVQQITDISRDLKMMALDLKVPVLALSQLSRQCENREDKRPRLSDLRESGAIEQDADVVLFLYRDSVYNSESPPGIAELDIAKHRNGETLRLTLFFDGPSMRYEEPELDEVMR